MVGRIAGGGQSLSADGSNVLLVGDAGGSHDTQARGRVEDVVQCAFELGGEIGEVWLATQYRMHHGGQVHIMHDAAKIGRQHAYRIAVAAVVGGVIAGVQLRVVLAFDAATHEIFIHGGLRLTVEITAKNQSRVPARHELLDISGSQQFHYNNIKIIILTIMK